MAVGNTIWIIGPGAVGGAVAASLADRGLDVVVSGRAGPMNWEFELDGRSYEFPRRDLDDVGLAIFTVPAFDLAPALTEHLSSLSNQDISVLPVCNGYVEDIVNDAAEEFPEALWRVGFCNFGVTVTDEGYGLRSSSGRLFFGPRQASDPEKTGLEQTVATAGLCEWHPSALQLARRKWLYNTVLNTITAADRLPRNGDVLEDQPLLDAAFAEGVALGRELFGGFDVDDASLKSGLLDLIDDTSENENSMARNRRMGLRTESDYLAGLADKQKYPNLYRMHAQITMMG